MRFLTGLLVVLFLVMSPLQALAVNHTLSLAQLDYPQDITVKGSNTQISIFFPLPKANIQRASLINLYLVPSQYLNPNSTFTFYLNNQVAATSTAGQLRQNSLIQLPLPPEAASSGGVSVGIRTGLFTTNDLCADYRKGFLFYTLRNQSNLMLNMIPDVPKTIPDFFAGLYQGLAVVIPQAPSKEEIAAGIWLYAALQKIYPYQNIQFVIGAPQGIATNLPQIWLAQRQRLPQNLQSPQDDLYLAQPNKLVVTATEERDLSHNARQLLSLPAYAALPLARSAVSVSGQASNVPLQDRIYFGNSTVQEGITGVSMDFAAYPGQLATLPQSLGIHLEGRYTPSPISGRPVRLDVFFNRNLVYSEALDNIGILNKDINLPENLNLKSHNQLSFELHYPEDENTCAVKGPLQNAQILSSSYYTGLRTLSRSRLTWDNVGMLFSRPGIIFLEDNPTPELIKAAAQAAVFLNSQLPEGQFSSPEIRFISEYQSPLSADYLIVLVNNANLPEELTKGLPLQFGQSSTIYQAEGQTTQFSYQSSSAGVIGQIGQYQGIPLIAFHCLQVPQKFSDALYALVKSFKSGDPKGNIYVYRDNPVFLSTLPPSSPQKQGITQFFSLPWNLYEQAYRLAGDYYRFLFLAILVFCTLLILVFRGKSKKK
jgi:hypothetical protein